MDHRDTVRMTKSIDGLQKAVDEVSRSLAKSQHPAYTTNPEILAIVPVKLDWLKPGISAVATFQKHSLGEVQIVINIVGENGAIVESLLHQMQVEALQLSVVAA